LSVAFWLPLRSSLRLHVRHVSHAGRPADVNSGKATASYVAFLSRSSLSCGGVVLSDSCFATGCGLCVCYSLVEIYLLWCALVVARFWLWYIMEVGWAQRAHRFSVCERNRGWRHVLNATTLSVAFWLPPRSGLRLHVRHVSCIGRPADVDSGKVTASYVAFLSRRGVFGMFSLRGRRTERGKRRVIIVLHVLHEALVSGALAPVALEEHVVQVTYWSPASPVFPVPHFRELRPESLKVPGMGLQLCGLQVWYWLVSTILWLYCVVVERQLDLLSVTARLRGFWLWYLVEVGLAIYVACGGVVADLYHQQ
ncbi:hypothetical protein Taro_038495, partial [Colocasia esculenta]|nr:hypothetical protein [Colocasia esculenta]